MINNHLITVVSGIQTVRVSITDTWAFTYRGMVYDHIFRKNGLLNTSITNLAGPLVPYSWTIPILRSNPQRLLNFNSLT